MRTGFKTNFRFGGRLALVVLLSGFFPLSLCADKPLNLRLIPSGKQSSLSESVDSRTQTTPNELSSFLGDEEINDSWSPEAVSLQNYEKDDPRREEIARIQLRRQAASRLGRALEGSDLRELYRDMRQTAEKTRSLVKYKAGENPDDSSPLGEVSIAAGIDVGRGFAPTLKIGDNVRLSSDVIGNRTMIEGQWRF